ncbi:ABC transporter substrate-binding protein [Candidatus Woesearchaeota archaeon]|jgi:branched-chain amino acid transport system substrate-binding protein|nr:ABC transporter substrate-binding protein [Candidatus Woesearchaeota archaeon]MBT3537530.1 ABC transporter substrate-binding protein [Candidatus Woesearchaeota archaeon]MBT4696834.1 ABC transporter substrate-binding protein [Candidatus Woesearchaeota archaeon]MBT4717655.1 ABC transporter substrate-binding protein [Candidatus Woesearchaeota archaeon]MBT7106160.1 ABC transporter substrate-binding protein [Candidatus Woesearchaeota archaeon]
MRYLLIIIALALLITGCGSQQITAQVTKEPVYKIGILGPFAGPTARYGEAMDAGYQLALEDLKDSGINFKLIYEDSHCDNKYAKTAAEKLIALDKVDILLGPYCDGTNLVASQSEEYHNKVMLSPVGVSRQHAGLGETFFRLQPSNEVEIQTLVNYIFDKTQHRNFVIVYLNNNFGFEYRDVFNELVDENNGKIIFEEGYELLDSDFRTTITKIKASEADAIFFVSSDFQAAQFIKQVREQQFSIPIYSTVNSQSVKIIDIAGQAAENLTFAFNDDTNLTEKQIEFYSRLKQNNYRLTGFVEANAYDALHLAVDALKECGSNMQCQSNFFNSISNYSGASGNIDLSSGDIRRNMVVKSYRAGEFIKVAN